MIAASDKVLLKRQEIAWKRYAARIPMNTIILHVLMDGDNYGYAISARIETDSCGLYPIKETTLYSAFARMEKKAW